MTFKFKKGDKVIVIAGKDKGKTGEIMFALHKKNQVVVNGVGVVVRHIKPNKNLPEGGRVSMEKPIDASNVLHVDPKTGLATRIGYKIDESGKKVRYARKSKEIL